MTTAQPIPPTLELARSLYHKPLTSLILQAQEVHHRYHAPDEVTLCALKSIKTGACPEDCAYCPQSSRANTFVEAEALMETEAILADARRAKAGGSVRFCMGAAWRSVRDGRQFDSVLDTVRGVKALGLQVCCTLGMLSGDQARRLKAAGCDVYNHNLDTSREFYPSIIGTRSYDDRLETLRRVRDAGMSVCSGGILGMGETIDDRLRLLVELASLDPQPDSVPINALVAVDGTPLAGREFVDTIEFVRTLATARILMPRAELRLSAGRTKMSQETQALCFLAGANSIFVGEKLLVTGNPDITEDLAMLGRFGLKPARQAPGQGGGADHPGLRIVEIDEEAEASVLAPGHSHSHAHSHAPDHGHPMRDNGTWAHACEGGGECDSK